MEQFSLLRLGSIQRNINDAVFDSTVQELKNTKYNINAIQSEAP